MAKKLKRKRRKEKVIEEEDVMVKDDVRESIVAIVCVAIGAVLILSFFGMAGAFGERVNVTLATGIGFARIVLPLILFGLAASVVLGDRRLLTVRNIFALFVFVVAFDGLADLLFVRGATDMVRIMHFGGQLGALVSSFLVSTMSATAAFILSASALLVAMLLLLNMSLRTLCSPVLVLFGVLKKKEDESDEEEVEESVPFDEREAPIIEDDAAAASNTPQDVATGDIEEPYVAPAERVMTSSQRRKITIPLDLLDDKSSEAKSGDIERGKDIIVKTFSQFGIDVEMSDVKVGPTVTQYAMRPFQGVKLSRIVALQDDLALALAAHPIRIEAPIPGKSLVGIEVPNQTIGRVCLRELLASKEFQHRKTSFTVPIGKDITGFAQLLAVEKTPHMLVAGATGSGKSVCLNTIIVSLMYQNGPDDLKFIMVDPKRVELGVYAGIPHLLVPPITKVDEAINALKWAVREMERRLDHLAKHGSRDIESYNAKAKERMPRIIVIIDELADLMSQNKRDVEAVIVRIAQMARAAGIHLILATQRPSVDVITGIIKANIPTRLAFAVASQVDSKTILDTAGADKLLGRGDMLMSTPELSKPRRLQGAFLSEKEIVRIVGFMKSESAPDYNYHITEGASQGGVALSGEDSDPLMEQAVELVLESGKASTSYLQRRMKIGYSRAARIVDIMEQMGIISHADGAKPREVLVSEWPPAGRKETGSARESYDEIAEDDVPEIDDIDAPTEAAMSGDIFTEGNEDLRAKG